IIPVIYYWIKVPVSHYLGLSSLSLLLILASVLLMVEIIRIQQGWLFFCQREYERKTPSAFIWTGLGLIVVLIFAPQYHGYEAAFTFPIIWSLAVGDPLLGECRRMGYAPTAAVLITLLPLSIIWLLTSIWFTTPYWLILVLPGLAILAEWPSIRWLDDNFIMMTVPLLFIKLFVTIQPPV
ncbi:MAG: hypothetical protein ACHP65_09505, partial [Legionellales bacterium]